MKVCEFFKNNRMLSYNITVEFRINNEFIRYETFNSIENISIQFKKCYN